MSGTNSTIECLKSRRSVKSYKPDMLPKEVIQEIVEAGTWVPTGMNRQSPIILAITDKESKRSAVKDECTDHGRKGRSILWSTCSSGGTLQTNL